MTTAAAAGTDAGDGAGHCWLGWGALSGTLNQLNVAFVTLLAVELAVSVCAHWPRPYLSRSAVCIFLYDMLRLWRGMSQAASVRAKVLNSLDLSSACYTELHDARRVRASFWSALDVAVVASSVASAFIADQPPGLVTALRAVRVLRIFGKVRIFGKRFRIDRLPERQFFPPWPPFAPRPSPVRLAP